MSFLIYSSSDFQEQKIAKVRSITYDQMKRENLSILYFRLSVKRKRLR